MNWTIVYYSLVATHPFSSQPSLVLKFRLEILFSYFPDVEHPGIFFTSLIKVILWLPTFCLFMLLSWSCARFLSIFLVCMPSDPEHPMYEECVQDTLYLIYQIIMTNVHLFQAYSLSKGAVTYISIMSCKITCTFTCNYMYNSPIDMA